MPKLYRIFAIHGQRDRFQRLRHGVVLALLALVSQTVIALLPMPAMAGGHDLAAHDFATLCGMARPGPADTSRPDKSAPHAVPACPICQAGHLAASLVPPTPGTITVCRVEIGWDAVANVAAFPTDVSFYPQQARAPPPSV